MILGNLKKRLKLHRDRKIKRDLKKNRFQDSFPVIDALQNVGDTKFSLGERSNELNPAIVYVAEGQFVDKKVPQCSALKVDVLHLSNTVIIARTDGFVLNGKCFHPDMLKQSPDRHQAKNQSVKLDSVDGGNVIRLPKSFPKPRVIKGATVSLVKEHSFNYYHFVFECLPKLLLILQQNLFERKGTESVGRTTTILIDEDVPQQCVEYLDLVVDVPYSVVRVATDEIICCEHLIYCSPFFDALDNIRVDQFDVRDFYVDRFAVEIVKKAFQSKTSKLCEPKKRIYLNRRTTQVRKIINAAEVEGVLQRYGYESVFADEYSLSEQIALFQGARVVVGASGAAFANMIHMQPDTSAIMFTPDLPFTNYHLFQQQADVSGVKLVHLHTDNPNHHKTLHDDVYLNVRLLACLLKELHRGDAV
jgi:capsular polysaccharide biosynthesis protein